MRIEASGTSTRKLPVEAGRQVRKMVIPKAYTTSRLCSVAAITFFASNAFAFKSDKAPVTLALPAPVAPFPFPDYAFGLTGSHRDASSDTEGARAKREDALPAVLVELRPHVEAADRNVLGEQFVEGFGA